MKINDIDKTLMFPISGSCENIEFKCPGPVVILGPNGSGKSRLGVYLTKVNGGNAIRIAAQRHLNMPAGTQLVEPEQATNEMRNTFRDGRVSLSMETQFPTIVKVLFSRSFSDSVEFVDAFGKAPDKNILISPKTKLKEVLEVWNELLPHRKLSINKLKFIVGIKGDESVNDTYDVSGLSDGERAIFYVLAKCMLSDETQTIIVDEPEQNLNKALQLELWDRIEKKLPNHLFVYVTHDVDFAISRTNATKICVNSFHIKDGREIWNWQRLEENDEIPEAIQLRIQGNRKPVLFVEGRGGRRDLKIYSLLYPNYMIQAVNGCDEVINFTKSYNKTSSVHRYRALGIVDRDVRSEENLAELEKHNIHSLGVSEIEALLLMENVIREFLINSFGKSEEEVGAILANIKQSAFDIFMDKKEEIIAKRVAFIIERSLVKKFNNLCKNKSDLKISLDNLISKTSLDDLWINEESKMAVIKSADDYIKILEVYLNSKELLGQLVTARLFQGAVNVEHYITVQLNLFNRNPERLFQLVNSVIPNMN